MDAHPNPKQPGPSHKARQLAWKYGRGATWLQWYRFLYTYLCIYMLSFPLKFWWVDEQHIHQLLFVRHVHFTCCQFACACASDMFSKNKPFMSIYIIIYIWRTYIYVFNSNTPWYIYIMYKHIYAYMSLSICHPYIMVVPNGCRRNVATSLISLLQSYGMWRMAFKRRWRALCFQLWPQLIGERQPLGYSVELFLYNGTQ